MNVLYLDWPCFGKVDVLFTMQQMGHDVTSFFHKDYQERKSADFDVYFDILLADKHFDFCFSYNYYPVVSEACKRYDLKYISFIYDSPYIMLYSYTLINPNNYVFIFDSKQYMDLKKEGISTVYYMPLPVNATIIDHMLEQEYDKDKLSADVSFVGALYNEAHNMYDRLSNLSDFTKGYLDAVMKAQLKVSGYNFMEEMLTTPILTDMQKAANYVPDKYGVETPQYVFANYFIDRKLTQIERMNLITAASKVHPLKLFTLDSSVQIPNVTNLGVADYYSEMPYIFHNSKINLNITLRSIQNGIPLRAMDIMGAGGFLLTNYQSDFLNHFVPGEDFVYYEDEKDLQDKIRYYLEHENERQQIAKNGHEKVKMNHSFEKCFQDIFEIVFH